MKLENKLAIVTGGASGLGKGGVLAFLESGCRVAVLDRNTALGDSVETQFQAKFGKGYVKFFTVDTTDQQNVKKVVDEVVHHFGSYPQILLNSAGIACADTEFIAPDLSSVHDTARMKRIFQVNLFGTFNMTKYTALQMARAPADPETGERGVILSIASIAATEGTKTQTAYSLSKGAVHGMTVPLSRSLGKHGIRVLNINPAPIITGLKIPGDSLKMAKFVATERFGTVMQILRVDQVIRTFGKEFG